MPAIIQRVGFEAASAIQTLRKFATALGTASAALERFNKAAGRGGGLTNINTALGTLDTQSKKAGKSIKAAGVAMETTGKQGVRAGDSLTISWKTFSRVIATQVIVRALAGIISAIGQAADEVGAFQIKVAEIANITEEGAESFGALTEQIEALSISLGRPIAEVASASMEALQNDLGSTAETMELLSGTANDLALITGSDLTSSINSISSVLKAYNLNISQSSDISDIFAVAIDKGRIKLSELESRLGTVLPQTQALGIGFEETAAAVASLTLSGLNSRIALTQFRNVMDKLLVPTESLEGVFEKLGVTSGIELVNKFGGLRGSLAAILKAVDGDTVAFAKLFGTIRGRLGVLNLSSQAFKNLDTVIGAMTQRLGRAEKGAKAIDQLSFRNLQKETELFNSNLRVMGDLFNQIKLVALTFINETIAAWPRFVDAIQPAITQIQRLIDELQSIIDPNNAAKEAFDAQAKAASVAAKALLDLKNAQTSQDLDQQQLKNANEVAGEQLRIANQVAEAIAAQESAQNKAAVQAGFFAEKTRIALELLKASARTARALSTEDLGRSVQENLLARARSIVLANKLVELAKQANTSDLAGLDVIHQKAIAEAELVKLAVDAGLLTDQELTATRGQFAALSSILSSRKAIIEAEEASGKTDIIKKQKIEELNTVLDAEVTKFEAVETSVKEVGTEVEALPDADISTTSAVANINSLIAAINRAIAAQRTLNAEGGGGTATAYHGGQPLFRAHGGRGQDTIPAMLSKDEFVVNARSSRQFFSQISAMNAGQEPAFREQGGSVTNIGDVNVNVTGGSGSETPDVLGRQIANSLRRELRRQTSAL